MDKIAREGTEQNTIFPNIEKSGTTPATGSEIPGIQIIDPTGRRGPTGLFLTDVEDNFADEIEKAVSFLNISDKKKEEGPSRKRKRSELCKYKNNILNV